MTHRPLGGFASAVCVGVAATALVSAACTAGGFLTTDTTGYWADLRRAGAAIRVILLVSTTVLLVAWLYRARVNLDRLPAVRPRWAAGWTIGALVVPIVGPVLFAAILAEVATHSVSPTARDITGVAARSRLVATAWAWLAAALPAALLFAAAPLVPEPAGYAVLTGAEGFQLVAAVLLIGLVRTVTWWQDGWRQPPRPWVPAPRQPAPGDATMRA